MKLLKLTFKTNSNDMLCCAQKRQMAFTNHLIRFVLLCCSTVFAYGGTMTETPAAMAEDFVVPVCIAPDDVTITCADMQLISIFPTGIGQAHNNEPEATLAWLRANFGNATSENTTGDTIVELVPVFNINDCGWGSIQRQFQTWQWGADGDINGNGQIDFDEAIFSVNSCTQLITITEAHSYRINFPVDKSATSIDSIDFTSQLEISTDACDIIAVNTSEAVPVGFTEDLCYKYGVTYDIINWCLWDGENEAYRINRKEGVEDDSNANHVVDNTNRAVLFGNNDGIAVDYTQSDDPGSLTYTCPDSECGRWIYTQYIRIYDPVAPCGENLPPCPVMYTAMGTVQIRPCLAGTYEILYCNIGLEETENASVKVMIDPALMVTGASPEWQSQQDNSYIFEVGDLSAVECGNIQVYFTAPCDDPAGTTYCSEVYAYPDGDCDPIDPEWDGSEIKLNIECLEEDSLRFSIENVGQGNMSTLQEYIIIEDNVLLFEVPPTYQLDAGEMMFMTIPAAGYHYYMESEQAVGFPGNNTPVSWIEGCGNSMNMNEGAVNQYPLGDEDSWYDVFCLESVNSYDPNDKTGFPRGVGDQHFIDQNIDLDYLIRFQNAGTADALYVEIRDTLATDMLNISTLRIGASSHAFTWELAANNIIVFRFEDINLPSEEVDPDGSNGFVQFSIAQQPDLAIGSQIKNTAAIYFDNNDPIITNETLHTIGEDYLATWIKEVSVAQLNEVRIFPNPTKGQVNLKVDNLSVNENLQLELYDLLGNQLETRSFRNADEAIDLREYPTGTYLFKIYNVNKLIGLGKIIKI